MSTTPQSREAGGSTRDRALADELIARLIEHCAQSIAGHADFLTELDKAIGDGDHGVNLKRGFDALLEAKDQLAGQSVNEALVSAGMILVMKVGGASGPLYGSLLMSMGRTTFDRPLDGMAIAKMFQAGVDAVMTRGRSRPGEKTMLDVLVPTVAAVRAGVEDGAVLPDVLASARQAAEEGRKATIDMVATKGRASFLGERSAGHADPGATSSSILVHAACDVIEGAL